VSIFQEAILKVQLPRSPVFGTKMDRGLHLSMEIGLDASRPTRPRWTKTRFFHAKIGGVSMHLRGAHLVCWLSLAMIVFSATVAHALDPSQKLSQYGRQAWQTDSGLPQNSVRAILQTRDGYLWFATREGLARFDGIDFAIYNRRNTPQFQSNDIRGLVEDGSGNLWISTANGVVRRNGSSFTLFTMSQGLPDNSVWSAFADSNGTIWAITAGGIARYALGRFIPFTTHQGLSSNTVNALADGPKGSLWVATDSGLDQIQNGRATWWSADSPMGSEAIHAIASDTRGNLWIGTQNGLRQLSRGKLRTLRAADGLPSNEVDVLLADTSGNIWIGTPGGLAVVANENLKTYTTADGLPGNEVQTIYQDREGTVWVGTNRGLARIAHGKIEAFPADQGLAGKLVVSIFEDREGSLWVGTESNGVEILRDQKFTTLTTADGLSDDLVTSVLQDRQGNLWIGTNNGGLNRYRGNRISVFTTKQGLTSDTIFALAEDSNGNLWIGTPNGLNRMEQGTFISGVDADLLPDEFVRSILGDSNGSLWVGTRHGLAHITAGHSKVYTETDGLANDFVGALTQSRDRSLWIGTLDGLSHFRNGKLENYTTKDGLSSNVITALYQDSRDNLWIGTNGEGLNVLRHGAKHRVIAFPSTLGLPDVIHGILEDDGGHLWISSNRGIFRVRASSLMDIASGKRVPLPITLFDTADGMKIRECSGIGHPSSWKAHNSKLFFSTLKGVAWIDPVKFSHNRIAPLVSIEQVSADGRAMTLDGPVVLDAGHRSFSLRYVGLSFVAPQKVGFQYRLSGFDKDWIDAGTRRVAYYTNIPPGRYRFQVRAANNDGVWSTTPASLTFQLKPYFYQTYWFYFLIALLTLLLGWLAYRWKVRQVESRFRAVLAERTRIAREIHDTLAQGFVGVSLQLELASQMLTTSPQTVRDQLDTTRQLVRESLSQARRSIWNLRSTDGGTDDFASRFTSAVRQRTIGKPLDKDIQFTGAYRPLRTEVEDELMKIALEAVTNVVRHAKATRVALHLHYGASHLHMSVEDDGTGFPLNSAAVNKEGHFGLIGMRERTAAIGGIFALDSSPGAGTRVSVEVPIV
jgi:ligand-binding sensor domain-containing protein/signal transduction histidine kinase